MKQKISATIICMNEAHNIEACLQSVSWCDEVIVVDSGSTDGTIELAQKHTPKVIQHAWEGYIGQKNFALQQATGDWVLCIDADECCTPELREAILNRSAAADSMAGFEVKRHVRYLGRWINHGGWYPDWRVRVVRRGKGRWGGVDPHDKLIAEGPTERLDAELHHYTYRDYAHQLRIINHFSDVATDGWIQDGKRFTIGKLFMALIHPQVKFLECYVWKLGFLDGWAGFVIAKASSFYVFTKYVKLWEKAKQQGLSGH